MKLRTMNIFKKDKLKYNMMKQRGDNTLPYLILKLISRIVIPTIIFIFIGKLILNNIKSIVLTSGGNISTIIINILLYLCILIALCAATVFLLGLSRTSYK